MTEGRKEGKKKTKDGVSKGKKKGIKEEDRTEERKGRKDFEVTHTYEKDKTKGLKSHKEGNVKILNAIT